MARYRWLLVAACSVLVFGTACNDSLHCEEKGAVEKAGSCTCPAGKQPDETGASCVAISDDGATPPTGDAQVARDAASSITEDLDAASDPPHDARTEVAPDAASDANDAGEDLDARAADARSAPPMEPDAGSDAAAAEAGPPDSGRLDPSVILDLSNKQPPTTIPAGEYPAQMRTGHWRFTWTPNFPSTAVPVDGRPNVILFQFGGTADSSDAIWLQKQETVCKAWVTSDSGVLLSSHIVFSAGQPITFELDLAAGTWTVTGATSGNGTFSHGAAFSYPNATLYVGRSPAGAMERFMGTFSNIVGVP